MVKPDIAYSGLVSAAQLSFVQMQFCDETELKNSLNVAEIRNNKKYQIYDRFDKWFSSKKQFLKKIKYSKTIY